MSAKVTINDIKADDLLMVTKSKKERATRVLVLTGIHAGKSLKLGDREVEAAPTERVKEIEGKGMLEWGKYLKRKWKQKMEEPFPTAQKEEGSTGFLSSIANAFRSSSTDSTPAAPPNTVEPEAPVAAPVVAPVVAEDFDPNTANKAQLKAKAEEIGLTIATKLDTEAIRAKVGLALTLLASDTSLGIMDGYQDAYTSTDQSKKVGSIAKGTIVVCLGKESEKWCRLITVDDRKTKGLFTEMTRGGNGKKDTNLKQNTALYLWKAGTLRGWYVRHDLSRDEKIRIWKTLFSYNDGAGVKHWYDAAVRNKVYPAADSAAAAPAAAPEAAAAPAAAPEAAAAPAAASGDIGVGDTVEYGRYNTQYEVREVKGDKAKLYNPKTKKILKSAKIESLKLVSKAAAAAAEEPAAETESKTEGGGGFSLGDALGGFASGVVDAAAAVGNTVAGVAATGVQNVANVVTAGAVPAPAAQGVTSDNNLVEIKAYAKSIGVKVADVQGNKRWKKSWLKAIEEKQASGGAAAAAAPDQAAAAAPDQAAAALEAATGGGESKSNSAGYGIGNKVIIAKKDGTANAWVYQITGVNADGTYKVKRVTKDGLGKKETKAATVLRRAASNVVAEYLQDDFLHLEHYKGEQEWEMEGMHEGMIDE